MNNIKLGFDFDGVIGESDTVLCDIINKRFGLNTTPKDFIDYEICNCINITREQRRSVIDELLTPNQTFRIKPARGALKFIQEWYEIGNKIEVVTTRNDHHPVYLFFEQYLPNVEVCIYSSRDKGTFCKKLGMTHFIDDHPQNILDLANAGIQPIVFDQLYNRNLSRLLEQLIWRVHSWEGVKKLFIWDTNKF
jgi:uncharacterized HAD superfamily protein